MNEKKAKELFTKYLNKECTPREQELLETFLDSYQDKERLWGELHFDEDIKKRIWNKIQEQAQPQTAPKAKFNSKVLLKYAAVALVTLTTGLAAYTYTHANKAPQLTIPDDSVVLSTGSGVKKIGDKEQDQVKSTDGQIMATQNGNKLVYTGKGNAKELVYNEISVPRGKTFQLQLSDGTTVYLNSDTSLKFPVEFVQGQNRKVFLKGEAYFEVAKDAKHPFSVVSEDMDVRVLGTHFNVSSYPGTEPYAVLVEGSVLVQDHPEPGQKADSLLIVPGQKACLTNGSIKAREVDVNDYLGWMQGTLIFDNEPFKEIVTKIERRYNVTIHNQYQELEGVRFKGKFTNETILDLLNTFKESAGFDYTVEDNKVIINKPKKDTI